MLQESFVVLPRVKHKKEVAVWNQGITSWNSFIDTNKVKGISNLQKEKYNFFLKKAKAELNSRNASFFATAIPFSDQWRLYEEFKDEAIYLDIETNGYYGGITVIGITDGFETKTMVRGFNLDKALLEQALAKSKLIVTFNGASFDLPVIERYFNLKISVPHIDLRFVCQKVGLTGGLKAIEKNLNIKRRPEVEGIAGEDAVYLWEMWKSTNNKEYLDKLILYNEEDILNLYPLASKVIPQLWAKLKKKVQSDGKTGIDSLS